MVLVATREVYRTRRSKVVRCDSFDRVAIWCVCMSHAIQLITSSEGFAVVYALCEADFFTVAIDGLTPQPFNTSGVRLRRRIIRALVQADTLTPLLTTATRPGSFPWISFRSICRNISVFVMIVTVWSFLWLPSLGHMQGWVADPISGYWHWFHM